MFPLKLPFMDFPMVFPWFSHGFPTIFPWSTPNTTRLPRLKRARWHTPRHRRAHPTSRAPAGSFTGVFHSHGGTPKMDLVGEWLPWIWHFPTSWVAVISSQLTKSIIFQRGGLKPPTSQKWMVYNGKSYYNDLKWMIFGVPIFQESPKLLLLAKNYSKIWKVLTIQWWYAGEYWW